jgi:hypothetical protein
MIRAIAVNLKLYYQARSLWLWYVTVIPIFFMWITSPHKPAYALAYLPISLLIGIVTGDLQKTVLTKPFSFALPGYRRASRSIMLVTGLFVNLLLGFGYYECFARYSSAASWHTLATACLGMVVFSIGVSLSFLPGPPASYSPFLVFFLFFGILRGTLQPLAVFLAGYPGISITLCLIFTAVIFKFLNTESLARRFSGRFAPGISDWLNSAKIQKYWKMTSVEKMAKRGQAIPERMDRIFHAFLRSFPINSRNRYVIGSSYIFSGWLSSYRWWWWLEAILLLPIVLFFCYFAEGIRNYLFVVPAFFVIQMDLIPHRSLLLARGRGEKMYAALSFCFLFTLASSLSILLLALLSLAVTSMMPDIPWRGSVLVYHPLDIQYFYVCPLFVPLVQLLVTLYRRERALVAAFCAMAGIWLVADFHSSLTPGSAIGALGASILVAASWLLCILGIGYHCLKQDLINQSG